MVLAKSHLDSDSEEEQPMEVEESHAVKVLPQHRWLLEQLPALSQFSSAKKEACAILRQVRSVISASTKLFVVVDLHVSVLLIFLYFIVLLILWPGVSGGDGRWYNQRLHRVPLTTHIRSTATGTRWIGSGKKMLHYFTCLMALQPQGKC